MSDSMHGGLSDWHWQIEDHVQRMPVAQWRKILLDERDTITWRGHVRRLVGKSIGFGLVEVSKVPLDLAPATKKGERDD